MPLHPAAQASLESWAVAFEKPLETLSVQEARDRVVRFGKLSGPGEPVARVEDRAIPGPRGDIPIRIYTPIGDGPFPLYVYFHGGGFVTGSIETADVACRARANAVKCIVVSVDYRLAPEHKFPAAVEDAYAATNWVSKNASSFNGDAQRLAVGGNSAGGNLASVVSLIARDKGTPRVIFQLIMVPMTNYSFDTKSYQEYANGYGMTFAALKWFWNHYLQTETDGENPQASPLRAKDLTSLPPALVLNAEYDPLRDEGEAYAMRLRDAGVPVTYKCYEGMVHFFLGPEAAQDIKQHLRAVFFGEK